MHTWVCYKKIIVWEIVFIMQFWLYHWHSTFWSVSEVPLITFRTSTNFQINIFKKISNCHKKVFLPCKYSSVLQIIVVKGARSSLTSVTFARLTSHNHVGLHRYISCHIKKWFSASQRKAQYLSLSLGWSQPNRPFHWNFQILNASLSLLPLKILELFS